MFKKKKKIALKKLKKPPSKVAQKNSNPLFFPLLPAQPKWLKQKNSCSKMWPIDQLYIELGAVLKNLGLGVNFRQCSEGYFLSGRP